ncbi:membrane protein [Pokkaliibacter plantistimulans]|uniref:Membrane protein n=2 Tax=Pseudomonadota TaxID=1224 RepID=A0ABX5LQ50_9GAMM|nr:MULTISPECIES: Yip1 family protein [Pokkaliibacter]MDH2431554.1 Yip1 family protein [Pokkaliibacter sp. MBI-7]PPC76322.1 hypothetical protein C4K68_16180 [Pokkaliibacter plantistimulans]PXF28795.1 membrane protein [Pokkaliibacter plantistimulans]
MFFQHMFGLIYHPKQEWDSIREEKYTLGYLYKHHILWLAAIPALSLFIGTTQMGWSIAGTNYVKLTVLSAIPIAAAFYIALMVGVGLMAWGVFWMEKTYGADASFDRCMVLTTFTATPLFMAGLAGLLPILWFDVFVVLGAVSYTVYLLYVGVPIVMRIPEERGFMFSTSVLTVGLCLLVGGLAMTAVLWGSGLGPVFTR